MEVYLRYLLFALGGFISGSVMYSYLFPKYILGRDIIDGSDDGNPGAGNVFKQIDPAAGMFCLIFDIAKGCVPVFMASCALDVHNIMFCFVMAAPVLGHAFSPMLHGRGGKAIATTFGVLLGLIHITFMAQLLAFFYIFFSVVVVISPHRLRSIVTFFSYGASCILLKISLPFLLGSVIISATVIFRHWTADGGDKKPSVRLYPMELARRVLGKGRH